MTSNIEKALHDISVNLNTGQFTIGELRLLRDTFEAFLNATVKTLDRAEQMKRQEQSMRDNTLDPKQCNLWCAGQKCRTTIKEAPATCGSTPCNVYSEFKG